MDLNSMLDSYVASSGPAGAIAPFARVLLSSPKNFTQLFARAAPSLPLPALNQPSTSTELGHRAILAFVDEWLVRASQLRSNHCWAVQQGFLCLGMCFRFARVVCYMLYNARLILAAEVSQSPLKWVSSTGICTSSVGFMSMQLFIRSIIWPCTLQCTC